MARPARTRAVPFRAAAVLAAAALVAWLPARQARAQTPELRGGTGIEFQYLDFDDPADTGLESVSLLTVPLGGRAALTERLTLEMGTTFARGEAERTDGSTSTLSGFTDAGVSLSWAVVPQALTVSATARVPTGQSEYTADELDAAGVFASDLFPFRVSNWGSGGGVGLRATSTGSLGEVGAALSVGYYRSGEFDPVQDLVTAYRPGDNVDVRAALEVPAGRAGRFDLQLGFQWFADDELGDVNVFEAGDRYEAVGRYTFPMADGSAGFVYSGYQRRGEGVRLQLAQPTTSQDLFLAGGGFRLRLGSDVVLRPRVDTRFLGREGGTSEGVHLQVGSRLEWTTGSAVLGPLVRLRLGTLDVREGVASGFQGFDLGANVRLGGEGG